MTAAFRVQQIDHVEVFVPDRYEAAKWYRQVFGLEILTDYEDWAEADGGPLMISSDGGSTKLALFQGEARGKRPTAGHHRVAFRVDGPGYLRFLGEVAGLVYDDQGRQMAALRSVDHDKSFSVYFCDPWGNRYEVTTYDYDFVAQTMGIG
ncbi:MAG: VOC family protein [Caldilineales bacterium]|nr:VOC family protein [Caldilineales bacterium]